MTQGPGEAGPHAPRRGASATVRTTRGRHRHKGTGSVRLYHLSPNVLGRAGWKGRRWEAGKAESRLLQLPRGGMTATWTKGRPLGTGHADHCLKTHLHVGPAPLMCARARMGWLGAHHLREGLAEQVRS